MDQDPIAPQPQDPHEETSNKPATSGAGNVDLGKILLPKKEVHAPENAERINAGALLSQEQSATLPVVPRPAPVAPPAPKDNSVVKAVETYQGDIESLVQNKNVSVVSIAAAEAGRRDTQPLNNPAFAQSQGGSIFSRVALIGVGAVLVVGALGVLLYILFKPTPSVQVETPAGSPLITVDDTQIFTVPDGTVSHSAFIAALNDAKNKVSLSLGLVERLNLVAATTTNTSVSNLPPITAQRLLVLLAPAAPDALVRSLDPTQYILGVHSYDSNQPFLIFTTSSYEQAFSAMLYWEASMQQDLSPLFSRTPAVQINQVVATASSTAATSTPAAASTTPQIIPTGFKDAIVENHDARVIEDSQGNILLLWTFLDRSTLVITTNEVTLREIISRLKNTPVVPTP